MIGRQLFSSKAASRNQHDEEPTAAYYPPPSYMEAAQSSEAILASTMTTTVTTTTRTTQTTTQFFSLPIWRRRQLNVGPPDPSTVGEDGILRSTSLMLDKDLPALPPTDNGEEVDLNRSTLSLPGRFNMSDPSGSTDCLNYPTALPRSSHFQPARALAQAALGLGLPHVMPNAPLCSTPSESNTVPFVGTDKSDEEPRQTFSERSHASSSTARTQSTDSQAEPSAVRRRTRGISLMPFKVDAERATVKGKGKELNASEKDNSSPPSKQLTRRPSFWNRRRLQSVGPTPPQPNLAPGFQHEAPSLPSFHPVSPLFFEPHTRRSDSPLPLSSAGSSPKLHRRHSERSVSYSSRSSPIGPYFVTPTFPHVPQANEQPRSTTLPSHNASHPNSDCFPNSTTPFISNMQAEQSNFPDREHQSTSGSRPRSVTNPPRLLHRLSMGLFLTSPPPLPVSSPTATTSVFASSQVAESEADVGSTKVTPSKPSVPKPSPDEESPEIFVDRLEVAVSKAEIANVLASSGSPFYTRALQAYIDRFPFHSDPLDVALRKLLMDVGLPRETQQIDRVMEAFASAYLRCNPGLFVSEDHPYILAFSLIMLHTDAFNKSNKRKMSKADYIKNTKLPGISKDVLECFYDNIVFAPFIFIEDPLDVNGQRGLVNDASPSKHISTSAGSTAANASLSKGSRIDPYFLITNNMLDTLRIDVENYVPQRNPYSYQGTAGSWDEKQLHRAFAHPDVIEVDSSESRRKSSILLTHFALSVGGAPGPILQHSTGVPDLSPVPFIPDVATLKVTKVGLLNRKEDVAEGGKRATNRKWKEWSVILTGSQLLFFRDPAWALGLIAQIESDGGQVLSPPMSLWRPDELLSTKDAIAVHDATYIKYNNTLRFVMSNGRHFLLQAEDEQERNEWIAHINYASAFKTAGIRMRAMNMSDKEVELTGMAAAASHLNSENAKPNARSHPHSLYCGANDANSVSADPSKSVGRMTAPPPRRSPKNASGNAETIDLETTSFLQPDSCQLKATFDHVKADLAAAELSTEDIGSPSSLPSSASSVRGYPITAGNRGYLEYSRPRIIRTKVQDLESKLEEIQVQLDADLRLARNLAILAPFQRSSRDRVRIAVVELSKRVMQVRLDMIKMTCHKDILMADLAAEDHDWQNSKRDALKVATQTVERNRRLHPYNASASASSRLNPNDSKLQTYDELEVSYSQPQSATQSYRSSRDESADGRRTSSVSDVNSPCSMSGNTGPSSEGFPFALDHTVTASRNASVPAQDELAEEWNKTRAAKRVSLVKVPADLKAASFHARGGGMRAICMEESAGVRTDPNQDPSSR